LVISVFLVLHLALAADDPIVFKPYTCATCVKEKRAGAQDKPITICRRPVEEIAKSIDLEKGWIAIESPHLKILSGLKRTKVKLSDSTFISDDLNRLKQIFPDLAIDSQGASLSPHQRAHLFQIRGERIYADFASLMGTKKPYLGMEAPYEFCLFDDYETHHRLVDKYMGITMDKIGAWHHYGEPPNFFLNSIYEQLTPAGDRDLSNHFVHQVAHNLAHGYGNYFRETPAWLQEGLAHYYERREQPDHNTFCYAEGKAPTMFEKPDWEKPILNMVRRGKDTPLPNWCEKMAPGELTAEEQALSWSLVKWMVETEPVRFAKIIEQIDDLKKKPTAAQEIEQAFGVSAGVMHQRWRDYVLKEYAKK
jgi:hypothetical protein